MQKLEDPQIALTLLRQCAAFCKFTHIARTTPPNLIQSTLATFDDNFRACFMECSAIDLSPNMPSLETSHAEFYPMVFWASNQFSSIALQRISALLVPPSLTTYIHHTSSRPQLYIMYLFLPMTHFHLPLTPSTPIDMFCH